MDKNLTEIVILLDKSGSMSTVASDIVGGLNTFIKKQKELPGEANFSLILFNTHTDTIVDRVKLSKVKKFLDKEYCPEGGTALLEAACKTIDSVGKYLADTKEEDRPGKVIFVIMTDGQENSSAPEFTRALLNKKITTQKEQYNWEILFLGANFDVFAEAGSYGVSGSNTRSYASTDCLASAGMDEMCVLTACLRSES